VDETDPGEIERVVLGHLDELGAAYEVIRIDPAFANTAAFCKRYRYPPDISANCILVAAKTGERRHAACLVQATRQLDVNRAVRRLLGLRKVSFAPVGETVALTGMLPDGVTPFGLPPGVLLYVDAGVMAHEQVIVGGGSRGLKLLVRSEVFARMPGASIVEGLAKPSP
jgi:prolyl-tRNA editing enzyme YbaK/EbsC (Cys-tRNA(Pro) deacylase)